MQRFKGMETRLLRAEAADYHFYAQTPRPYAALTGAHNVADGRSFPCPFAQHNGAVGLALSQVGRQITTVSKMALKGLDPERTLEKHLMRRVSVPREKPLSATARAIRRTL